MRPSGGRLISANKGKMRRKNCEIILQIVGRLEKSTAFRGAKYRFTSRKVPLFLAKSTAFLLTIPYHVVNQVFTLYTNWIAKLFYKQQLSPWPIMHISRRVCNADSGIQGTAADRTMPEGSGRSPREQKTHCTKLTFCVKTKPCHVKKQKKMG